MEGRGQEEFREENKDERTKLVKLVKPRAESLL